MPTLTATSAMRQALTKAAIPAPRHAVHKSPIGPPIAQKATPAPEMHPPAIIEERPATRDPAGVERRNALFMKLRQLSPVLFAAKKPVPLAIGIFEAIVERLALDADAEKERGSDLRVILSQYVNRYRYQKALRDGTQRFGLDGKPAGEVTEEQRELAAKKVEKFKAKAASQIR